MPRTASPIGFLEPMHPSPADRAPEGDGWLHEVKYDGYRTQLVIDGKNIQAFTRNGHDWTDRYGPVIAAAQELRCRSAILDGEICVQNERGLTDFRQPPPRDRARTRAPRPFAFDLLLLEGRDLRGDPLLARRLLLHDLVGTDLVSRSEQILAESKKNARL